MAIYDINGAEIQSAYDIDGVSLQSAYNVDGLNVYEASYSISNVAYHFRERTLEVASQINALSGEWVNLIFITDTHGSENRNRSQAVGMYLLDNTSAELLILGGDYSLSDWDKSQYDEYAAPYLESEMMDRIYALMGNHETLGTNASASAKSAIYEDFLADKTDITGNPAEVYYYKDDTVRKIRYMFLNTSDGGQISVTGTQILWIQSNVILPTDEWSLIVFGHITLNSMGGLTTLNVSNGASVIDAITQCNGTVTGYICGHQHIDFIYNDGEINYATLYVDKFENKDWFPGYSITDRVSGTYTEQAITVISINTTTKDVVFRRIGAGRNQQFSYNYS